MEGRERRREERGKEQRKRRLVRGGGQDAAPVRGLEILGVLQFWSVGKSPQGLKKLRVGLCQAIITPLSGSNPLWPLSSQEP